MSLLEYYECMIHPKLFEHDIDYCVDIISKTEPILFLQQLLWVNINVIL